MNRDPVEATTKYPQESQFTLFHSVFFFSWQNMIKGKIKEGGKKGKRREKSWKEKNYDKILYLRGKKEIFSPRPRGEDIWRGGGDMIFLGKYKPLKYTLDQFVNFCVRISDH